MKKETGSYFWRLIQVSYRQCYVKFKDFSRTSKTYSTVLKDYHTELDIKIFFANDGLIELKNKYQRISIKLLSLYLVQHNAAPNKGTTILY